MTEVERIKDQYVRAFSQDAWYGKSLKEILDGVTFEAAAAHPIADVHSILEIVLHISFTQNVMRRRIEGEDVAIVGAEDLFFIEHAEAEQWEKALENLEASYGQLCATIDGLNDADLHKKIINRDHTVYFLLEGLIQHLTYHAGQIAFLKKAQPSLPVATFT